MNHAEHQQRLSDVKSKLKSFDFELPNEEQRVNNTNALKQIDGWNIFYDPRTIHA